MAGQIKKLSINNLVNHFENPRHAVGQNEEDTLRKLFDAVGVQYMLNLAEDIQKNGLLGNQQIVVVYSDSLKKYVVYEGNRRIAAIKLLLAPDSFSFLDRATIEKAKNISVKGTIPNLINCYVTDEQDAFFIMERYHSGEDKGRGVKQWTSREKEVFKVRQNHQKQLAYLIDYYIKEYFDGFDLIKTLPFTTIQRIFNNRKIKNEIGLDNTDETSFSYDNMQLVIEASKWILEESNNAGVSVTRLFNKADAIEERLLPWIRQYKEEHVGQATINLNQKDINPINEDSSDTEQRIDNTKLTNNEPTSSNTPPDAGKDAVPTNSTNTTTENIETTQPNPLQRNEDQAREIEIPRSSGGNKNLPYFFQGLNYSRLDPNDALSHGVSAVCRELQLFSDKKLVAMYPIATTFLVRSIIEQSLVYYSKKTNVQGQNKRIWDYLPNDTSKLSKIIENYKRNLPNYITDPVMRQYFKKLFDDYEQNVDPLNWVIHRPAEFQLDPNTLIELPRKGLLALINYLIS